MSLLKQMVEAEIARRQAAECSNQIEIKKLIVEPVYRDGVRIGSRVWDNDVELEESDPEFRRAVWGKENFAALGEPSPECDAQDAIVGGGLIFRRVAPGDDQTGALDRAADRIDALRRTIVTRRQPPRI
jgi:hypothetical protein